MHTTDDLKVASLKELLCICILQTDSEREAGKVFLHCSQNINATHLSASLHCNSKHVFSFLRVCVYIYLKCVYMDLCVQSSKSVPNLACAMYPNDIVTARNSCCG